MKKPIKRLLNYSIFLLGSVFISFVFMTFKKRYTEFTKKAPTSLSNSYEIPKITKCGFIVNPTAKNFSTIIDKIKIYFKLNRLAPPPILITDIESNGKEQAKELKRLGCDTIIAVGGDGTAGAVASELNNTDIKFAIIPAGTGNVFSSQFFNARKNIDFYLDSIFNGLITKVDVGKITLDDQDEKSFLTVAGVGFDGYVIQNMTKENKKYLKHFAYYYSAAKSVFSKKYNTEAAITSETGETKKYSGELRSLMGANIFNYKLFSMTPEAKIDDGLLNVIFFSTLRRVCIFPWIRLIFENVVHSFGFETSSQTTNTDKTNNQKNKNFINQQVYTDNVDAVFDRPVPVQADGEFLGLAEKINICIDKRTLNLIVPNNIFDQ